VLEGARSEGALDAAADLIEIDAQRGERVAVKTPARPLASSDGGHDLGVHAVRREAVGGEDPRRSAVAVLGQRQEEVLSPNVIVSHPSTGARGGDHEWLGELL